MGGLALTYFLVMGSGGDNPPSHIPTAETPLEPPIIETPTAVAIDTGEKRIDSPASPTETLKPPSDKIADVPPPPFNPSFTLPPHIEVADTKKPGPAGALPPSMTPAGANPNFGAATNPVPPRDAGGRYEGRIGPSVTAQDAPRYPTTDPATFLYRPEAGSPPGNAANTARLEGTIAPPPMRR